MATPEECAFSQTVSRVYFYTQLDFIRCALGVFTHSVPRRAFFIGGAGAAPAAAETAAPSAASPAPAASDAAASVPKTLTVEQAVAAGLAADPGVLSAALDAQGARARAADARDRMLPSLAVSAGYSRLSDEPTFSFNNLPSSDLQALYPYMSTLQALAPVFADLLPNIDQAGNVRIDLQYPVFAGFRIHEAAEIAKLQALGKEAAADLSRRALTFEIRRAYWEALRASANVETLRKALELESVVKDEVEGLSAQGMATDAEKLAEDARLDQSKLALDDAQAGKDLAFLVLSALVGDASASSVSAIEYSIASVPGSSPPPSGLSDSDLADARLGALVDRALANRPETRAAAMALNASLAAGVASKADLYPACPSSGASRTPIRTLGCSPFRTSTISRGPSGRGCATTWEPSRARWSGARRQRPTRRRRRRIWIGSETRSSSTCAGASSP